ncbi:hypothetical protein F4802DRAFT_578307 [Xylaria palmicola]|nr:hypothetical protein F4802DRAFT_578307 [Xylaria palmicola]
MPDETPQFRENLTDPPPIPDTKRTPRVRVNTRKTPSELPFPTRSLSQLGEEAQKKDDQENDDDEADGADDAHHVRVAPRRRAAEPAAPCRHAAAAAATPVVGGLVGGLVHRQVGAQRVHYRGLGGGAASPRGGQESFRGRARVVIEVMIRGTGGLRRRGRRRAPGGAGGGGGVRVVGRGGLLAASRGRHGRWRCRHAALDGLVGRGRSSRHREPVS